MTGGPAFTSPLALLSEWRDRADGADLHELLLLGFAVELPFLERTAIPAARALGARVTVVGDAAQAPYDPVDVRSAGRTYVHGLAACEGAFNPKLALLVGADEVVAAIGSGDPTLAGWAYGDELWTVLRGTRAEAPAALAQLGEWLQLFTSGVAVPEYVDALVQEIAGPLASFTPDGDGAVQVLHNLDSGLLGQLPRGPVEELCLYAPSIDGALTEIIERFDPERLVVGVQEHWTRYDGAALLSATGDRKTEVRLLAEDFPRHGKLLEWASGGKRWALTGSADLTTDALIRPTVDGGNCELAVLSPVERSLMPAGPECPAPRLDGHRTAAPTEERPALSVLGALVTAAGVQVTLAGPAASEVTIETSPDGSPASWKALGTIPAGQSVATVAAPAGAVIRAGSRPVFAVHPARCARLTGERLRHPCTEEEIFTDEDLARGFRQDLHRLAERLRDAAPARWSAYLEDCEGTIGRPLTAALFGSAADRGWGLAPGEDTGEFLTSVPPTERTAWQRWLPDAVEAATPEGAAPPPLVRMLVARLFVQLLGHGVWDVDDPSWRTGLARLIGRLPIGPDEEVPEQVRQQATALTAVCMGLLRSGAPEDQLTAEVWAETRPRIADTDPALAEDLLMPPVLPRAHVLSRSELEGLLQNAQADDPIAHIAAELDETGWTLENDEGLYRVHGSFSNPVPVAARVATLLGEHVDIALVQAVSNGRWAFVAWRRPDLLLASAPAGNAWRLYRLTGLANPESRLAGGEGITSIGMVGRPVRIGLVPPETAQHLLADAGTDHLALIRRLTAAL